MTLSGRRFVAVVALSLAFGAVSACGGDDSDGKPSPREQDNRNQEYASVEELRDAYVDAGNDCPTWDQDDAVSAALESGTCDDETVLSIYPNRQEALAAAETLTGIGADLLEETTSVLVGPNWVINAGSAADYPALKTELGGTIKTSYAS